jgi:PRTRC genetic system ThiF family protein
MLDTTKKVNVLVIGAGGNGSGMMEYLIKIDAGLKAMHCPGLDVIILDDDTVAEHNIVRQGFFAHEIGYHKSVILAHRANLTHGLGWQGLPRRFTAKDGKVVRWADVIITAVDSIAARRAVAGFSKPYDETLWLDMGVEREGGQVVLGRLSDSAPGSKHPNVVALYPEILTLEDSHTEPSCSAAESLSRQGLFVNNMAAIVAGQMLWRALRTGAANAFQRFDLAG